MKYLEIRTPLIGITGMINFMLATTLTVEQLDYAHTIQQSADALLLVINDILDFSKVEAGMMKLEMEPFSVRNMIEDANELLSTLAIQKGLELSFIVEDNVPEVVCGDRIRLRQVLLNVIGVTINIPCNIGNQRIKKKKYFKHFKGYYCCHFSNNYIIECYQIHIKRRSLFTVFSIFNSTS